MTTTATYGVTGNAYIDGILSGGKWGVTSLTFSFPATADLYGSAYASGENLNNFSALNTQQANAVRDILKMYASYSNLTFTEVIETTTSHGELRYAESDSPGTAWAYYPSTSPVGGDVWFNNAKHYYDAPARGNYAWLTALHETGHALGLKHAHEGSGSFGAMPLDHDSLEYTVMSYRSYVGASTTTGYSNGDASYPQTLMMYDIAAIQKMYGANYATNAGDTVYSWSATTGTMSLNSVAQAAPSGNKIFMTIWDGGGDDTYSFANYTAGVTVDLAPGAWSTASANQLANLAVGHNAVGNIANALLYNGNTASLIENAIGGSGSDSLAGNVADNKLTGGAGNDVLNGREGNDTAVYSGLASNYLWVHNLDDSWTVTDLRLVGSDGIDTLSNIEYLKFSDQILQISTLTSPPAVPQDPPPPPPPANVTPTAVADTYSTAKGAKLSVSAAAGVLKNDSDPDGQTLTASLVSSPGKGNLSLKADGSFVYSPAKNFAGTVTFKYAVSDGNNTSAATSVTIAVGTNQIKKPHKGHASGADDGEHNIPAPSGARDQWHFVSDGFGPSNFWQSLGQPSPKLEAMNLAHMFDTLDSVLSQFHPSNGLTAAHGLFGLDFHI